MQERAGRRAPAELDGRREIMRRILQGVGAEHEDVVEAHAFPVDAAQIGDAGGPLYAEYAKGQHVADLQTSGVGKILIDRNQRLACIHWAPPRAFGQLVAFRQTIGIGQAAFPAQGPRAVRNFVQISGAGHCPFRAECEDGATQCRDRAPACARIRIADQRLEFVDLIARDIEHEIVGRTVRHAFGDIAVDGALNRCQQDKGRKSETEGGYQRAGG